jgi:molecular chaperone DnaK (HSP70)
MSDSVPPIGIDFGTTNSSMAWYDPRTQRAEVIKTQGEDKTPSMVFFGENETLVGKPVDELIEDISNDISRRGEVFRRTITSIKRNLIAPPRIALPDGRYVRPVDVVAEIMKNLKREAQERHFHREVRRAVVTCPAEFNVIQRRKIEEGGRLAGFEEVALIEEPAAAALAYARAGLDIGKHVLVYDLGGGTFDLAVLENEEESFRVAMEPKGIDRCGGDDFDLALYYHCEEHVRERLGRPISLDSGVDLKFLRLCRRRKENLSWQEHSRFSNYLSSEDGPVRFEHEVERKTFESLIDPYVEETLLLTRQMLEDAGTRGFEPDATVLIGGSTRVPLVEQMLVETLPVAPLKFDKAEVAVALGAACYADVLWPSSQQKPASIAEPAPTSEGETKRDAEEEQRRRGVEENDLPDAAFVETVRSEARTPSTLVEVPDLSGLNRSEAKSALTDVGLKVGIQTKAPNDTVPEARIIKQRPARERKQIRVAP